MSRFHISSGLKVKNRHITLLTMYAFLNHHIQYLENTYEYILICADFKQESTHIYSHPYVPVV